MNFNPLFIHWNPDETAFSVGSFEVRWYSLCWLAGLALGYLLMRWLYKRQKLSDEQFEPLFLYVFLSVLIGARLGHCLFYEPAYFLGSWDHFIEMFIPMRHLTDGTWKFVGYQGLASHGGVLGLLAGLWLYVRHLKVPGWVVLDNMGICAPLTSMFIRLGNLMNSEIIGAPSGTALRGHSLPAHIRPYPIHLPETTAEGGLRTVLRTVSAAHFRLPLRRGIHQGSAGSI